MQRISYLILRHLREELSGQEREELQYWIQSAPENRDFFEKCTDDERLRQQLQEYGKTDTDAGWERFAAAHQLPSGKGRWPMLTGKSRRMLSGKDRWQTPSGKITRLRWWMAAAAAVLLLAVTGIYLLQRPAPQPVIVQQKEILPGSSKAVLTLADGTTVPLDSAGNRMIRPGIVQQGGQLQYNNATGTVSYNVLATPKGGQFRLSLPDGTKVWLNAASSLRYPTAFTGAERVVEVTGEAYFEVTPDAGKPFRVAAAGQAVIEVLGTRFNVNAYPDESSINTTLLEGAVKVSAGQRSAVLKPGEQAQVNASGHISVMTDVDQEEAIAWKNELFYFRNADVRAVMRQLERWYDVKVEYAGTIPERRFQGEIQRNLPLADVLEGLKNTGIRFTIEERTIIVRP